MNNVYDIRHYRQVRKLMRQGLCLEGARAYIARQNRTFAALRAGARVMREQQELVG